MIVDDSPDNRAILRDVLKVLGHEVISELGESLQAVDEFAKMKPDVLFLDIAMPRIDGFTVLSEIKQKFPSAKIAIISATDSEKMIEQSFRNGASAFVTKPYDIQDINRAILEVHL